MQFSVPADRAERSPKGVGSIGLVRRSASRGAVQVQSGIRRTLGRSAKRSVLTVRIGGKFSMYCLYIMEKFPSIVILICKIWKKSYCLFHILHNNVDSMENSKKFRPDPKLRLMDQVRQVLRYHHYAYRTEQTYCKLDHALYPVPWG